ERRHEVEGDDRKEPDRQHEEHVAVAAGDDAIDDRAGEEREGERERLEQDGESANARPVSDLPQRRAEITTFYLRPSGGGFKGIRGLEDQGDAREGLPELRHGNLAPPAGWIQDEDSISGRGFKDDEVVETPVKDRRCREVFESGELELHSSTAEAKIAGGV